MVAGDVIYEPLAGGSAEDTACAVATDQATCEQYPEDDSVVTITLVEHDGKTTFTVTSLYPSRDIRDMVLKTGMEHGAALSMDRLEEIAVELLEREKQAVQ